MLVCNLTGLVIISFSDILDILVRLLFLKKSIAKPGLFAVGDGEYKYSSGHSGRVSQPSKPLQAKLSYILAGYFLDVCNLTGLVIISIMVIY